MNEQFEQIKQKFRQAYQKAREDSIVYGVLGKRGTTEVEVPGRRDMVYVTLPNVSNITIARNEAGVPLTAGYPVKMRLEHKRYVIVGRSTLGDVAAPVQTPTHGGYPHTHMLAALSDVDLTGLADGDVIVWDATAEEWIAGTPGGGAVDSVNGETGTVVLDADDIDETASRIWFTTAEETKLAGIEAGADVTDAANIAAAIIAQAGKTTPVDTDIFPGLDSADTYQIKEFSWADIKATLLAIYNGLYVALTGNQTVAGNKTLTGQSVLENATYPVLLVNRLLSGVTTGVRTAFSVRATTTADMADGLASGFSFELNDSGVSGQNIVADIVAARSGGDTSAAIRLRPYSGGSPVEAVTLMPSGRVGINTNAPDTPVQLVGESGKVAQFRMTNSGGADVDLLIYEPVDASSVMGISPRGGIAAFAANTGPIVYGTAANQPMYLGTNNIVRMLITAAGLFGLSVTTPLGKLHMFDGVGYAMQVGVSGIAGSAVEIIPNAAGDVTNYCRIQGVYTTSNGERGSFTSVLANGATADVVGIATNLRFTVNANGQLTAVRSSGTATWQISAYIQWI